MLCCLLTTLVEGFIILGSKQEVTKNLLGKNSQKIEIYQIILKDKYEIKAQYKREYLMIIFLISLAVFEENVEVLT